MENYIQLSCISKALFNVARSLSSIADLKSVLFISDIHIRNVDQIVSDICDNVPEFVTSFPLAC